MYIFTSLNTHFLPHVLGLSCFRIYFGNCAVNWSLVNVRLYCCEDWIGEFISPKFDKLFWLSETVCWQSLVLSVKVVEEGGGKNQVVETTCRFPPGCSHVVDVWWQLAQERVVCGQLRGNTEALCSEKTQKLCVYASTSTAFRNHAVHKVFPCL